MNNVTINGKEEATEHSTILEMIKNKGYKTEHIVIEHNGIILHKTDWERVAIKDGDRIEIVGFVGGG